MLDTAPRDGEEKPRAGLIINKLSERFTLGGDLEDAVNEAGVSQVVLPLHLRYLVLPRVAGCFVSTGRDFSSSSNIAAQRERRDRHSGHCSAGPHYLLLYLLQQLHHIV